MSAGRWVAVVWFGVACGPGGAQTGGSSTTGDGGTSGVTGEVPTGAISTETGETTGAPPALCAGDPDNWKVAGFSVTAAGWPVSDETLVIDAPCLLTEIGHSSETPVYLTLQCEDPLGEDREVELAVVKSTPYELPLEAGQQVALRVEASVAEARIRGVWSLRDDAERFLIGGVHADTPGPAGFFAPWQVTVADDACAGWTIAGCGDARPLVITVSDGEAALAVGHYQVGVLGGLHVVVQRALQRGEEPAPCSDQFSGPEALQFILTNLE